MKPVSCCACCFTGHRDIAFDEISRLKRRLRDGICYLYDQGVNTFYAGGALGFDTLAAEAVLDYREARSEIRLILVLPCRDQDKYWRVQDSRRYHDILGRADRVICLSERYTQGCMQRRNRYLVEHSAYCICYLLRASGGSAYTVRYAKSRGLTVYNLKGT